MASHFKQFPFEPTEAKVSHDRCGVGTMATASSTALITGKHWPACLFYIISLSPSPSHTVGSASTVICLPHRQLGLSLNFWVIPSNTTLDFSTASRDISNGEPPGGKTWNSIKRDFSSKYISFVYLVGIWKISKLVYFFSGHCHISLSGFEI